MSSLDGDGMTRSTPATSLNIMSPPHAAPRGPVSALLDLFSSVWLGIVLAFLLFLYCTIGSAVPAVRKHPLLEMTEFEWFHWWPFNLIIILFSANLVIATVRRIPLRMENLGVWMIHAGIIVLTLGSYDYFSTKVEGDTPVFRRHVTIELPGVDKPTSLVALTGSENTVLTPSGVWRFRVQDTNTAWPILSRANAGEKAYAVNVMITPPNGQPFIRQLLDGYPEYTEDIIPGKGRAIKSIGRKLVTSELKLTLAYEPQDYFHVMDTWALFLRRAGDTEWVQRPISWLPRYHDRIGSREQVFTAPHDRLPLRALDLEVPAPADDDPLKDAKVHITGYLRYARMQNRWRDGGDQLNPVLQVRFMAGHQRAGAVALVAFDPSRQQDERGMMEFVWLDDASKVNTLPVESVAKLSVEVPQADVSITVPITPDKVVGRNGPFTPIEGTSFSYRIQRMHDHLALPGDRGVVSVAIVDIKTPEGTFTRWVADPPGHTRDMSAGAHKPHGVDSGLSDKLDPRIRMKYQPQSAPIIFAGYPNGLYLAVNGREGRQLGRAVEVGEVVEVAPGLSLRAESLLSHATLELKPFIVPKASRRSDAGQTFSMIQLEVDSGHGRHTQWVPFNQYALPNAQYAYGGRFAYTPIPFAAPDGTKVEVLFSRERRRLPYPVALQTFELDTHVGGYTGQAATIRNYISQLRFLDGDRWTDARAIKVNAPTEYGGYWYFQSTWDKPMSGDPSRGMNYTGLGVGNRNGVYIQLAGCCLAVAGMIFAFYIKPIIRRRREEQASMTYPRGFETRKASVTKAVPEPAVEVS